MKTIDVNICQKNCLIDKIFRQMKNKGMSLPELPSIIDED